MTTLYEMIRALEANNATLRRACQSLVKAAKDAHEHWDKDRDSKVGKLLSAMSGYLTTFRADVTEAHKALAAPPPQPVQGMTDREIVDRCNVLARIFYQAHGYEVEEGYRFDQATHPQERGMWNLAVAAYDFIEGTDVEQALAEVESQEEDE